MLAHKGSAGAESSIPYPEHGDHDSANFPEADFGYGDSPSNNSLLARSLRLVLGDVARDEMPGSDNLHARQLKGVLMHRYRDTNTQSYTNMVNIGNHCIWSF